MVPEPCRRGQSGCLLDKLSASDHLGPPRSAQPDDSGVILLGGYTVGYRAMAMNVDRMGGRMNGKTGLRISSSALILATAPTLMVPVAAYSQTSGTERREDRRDDRNTARDTRKTGRENARDAKQACKEGDKNRAECRQMKRNIKQDARQDARDSKKD